MIVAVVGKDIFSKNAEITSFLKKSLGDRVDDPMASTTIYGADAQISSVSAAVIEACDTVSMFSPEQTVVLKQAECLKASDSKVLAEWLQTSPECSLLIDFEELKASSAIAKALKSIKADIKTFEEPKEWQIEKWIVNLCQNHFGKRIEPGASNYIKDALGTDTANIVSELEKILLLQPSISVFTEQLVKDIIVPQRDMKAYEIVDSFEERNARDYVKKIHELFESPKVDSISIVATLYESALKLFHVCSMLEKGMTATEIASHLGISEYIFVKKNNVPRRAKIWGKNILLRLIKRLAELDCEFKTGKYPTKLSQELALAALVIPPR